MADPPLDDLLHSVNELRKHVGELEAEIAQMTDATDHARRDRSALEQESRLVQEKLERDLSDARREILGLRIKLEQYSDYDEVKRELEILKVSV
jgi:homeobox protein cut-like